MDHQAELVKEQWVGDVLQRKPYADFLTNYLVSKMHEQASKSKRSFTLALDAQWGQGKTFFVTKWAQDLREASPVYPTMIFDAWSADYGTEPMVGFMASFKVTLDERVKAAGLNEGQKSKAIEHILQAVNGFRRAIVPAGKVMAQGLLKKTTGVAIDEIFDVYKKGGFSKPELAEDKLVEVGLETLNKGLDEFFNKALEEQTGREQAISEFRKSIEDALLDLSDCGAIALPMFVFIDELDRCRPNFAIELLEGVKHLFGIQGVCFIVSTNMAQLSESIKAVYGSGFDGYGYLKRFFDVEYSLPFVSGRSFMTLLLAEHPELKAENLALGLPNNGFDGANDPMDACYVLTWVAEVFVLDLRSQRTVVEMVFAAASGVPKGKKIFLLWLSVLCAIKYKCPDEFEKLAVARSNSSEEFHDVWDKATVPEEGRLTRSREPQRVKLKDVAWHYYGVLYEDLKELRNHQTGDDIYEYPRSVELSIMDEAPSSFFRNMAYPPSIRSYFYLVQTAGHLVAF